jgi:outer membrane protein assembly factor BamB
LNEFIFPLNTKKNNPMANLKSFGFILILLIIHPTFVAQAQNWPCFRGPDGDGTSTETNLPTHWDSVTNVLWKSPVPGFGHSSPIIWEDKLFTFTAFPETQEKVLLCYDCKNGNLLWQKTVLKNTFENKHNDNSYASGTPATDGTLVYLSFLDEQDAVVAAYDFTGKQIWIQRPGTFYSPHGYSCSPVLFGDKVIINGDSKGDSFIAALSRVDGHVIWKFPTTSRLTVLAHQFSGKWPEKCR